MATDEQLMSRVAHGDSAAFGELVERHQQTALNVACRFLGDRGLAEDVAQEAFLKVLAAAPRYRPTARFTTYLYNVIWHLCVDLHRRRRPVALQDEGSLLSARPGPSERMAEAERRALVRQALDALPPRQRMAVVLKHFEDLSYDDIAAAIDCSPRAVDSLLVRARRRLVQALEGRL